MSNPAVPLYPYEKRWLADKSRFKVGKWSRQIGKTFTTTLEIVDDCFAGIVEGRRNRWIILSRGERQAKEAMEENIKRHCQAYNLGFKSLEYSWRGDEGTYNALEVALPGGSRITAIPSNPDTARGFSGNVFLDEFAHHQDPRKIWQALFPIVSSKSLKLRVASTIAPIPGKFDEITKPSNKSPWSIHTVDIYQAVQEGLQRNITELRAALDDEEAWALEYELRRIDSQNQWLSYALISGVEDELAGNPDLYSGGETFVGNDIGRKKDLWCAWVWERVGDILWTRELRTLRAKSFAEQDAVLDELVDRYAPTRIAMDQTGLGEKPVEDAKLRYGDSRVEGIMFTTKSKQLLAQAGKRAFEDRTIRIPAGDMDLRNDLHKLRKVVTPLGNVRFDAEADASGHADRAWAAFLGIYAASSFAQPASGTTVASDSSAYIPQAMKHRTSFNHTL